MPPLVVLPAIAAAIRSKTARTAADARGGREARGVASERSESMSDRHPILRVTLVRIPIRMGQSYYHNMGNI